MATLPQKVHSKLAAGGLTNPRIDTVDELISEWLSTLKPKTRKNSGVQSLTANLRSHFGADFLIREITETQCRQFEHWLRTDAKAGGGALAKATVSRRMRRAKQVFAHAVRAKYIVENPFEFVKGSNEVNRKKDFEVAPSIIDRLLDACADVEFRAMIALVRYGGLRCSSETVPFKWSQVYWDRDTFLAVAPKTEDYEDKELRIVPLFKPLRAALDELWERASERQELVFPNHQINHKSITSKLEVLCRRIGIAMWPRPWKNMRSTCISEWLRTYMPADSPYSIADLAAWAGHSPQTMLKHYAQIVKEQSASSAALFGGSQPAADLYGSGRVTDPSRTQSSRKRGSGRV